MTFTVIRPHFLSCDLLSCHVTSFSLLWLHCLPCDLTPSCDLLSYQWIYFLPCDIISSIIRLHLLSCDLLSCQMTSLPFMRPNFLSCDSLPVTCPYFLLHDLTSSHTISGWDNRGCIHGRVGSAAQERERSRSWNLQVSREQSRSGNLKVNEISMWVGSTREIQVSHSHRLVTWANSLLMP